MNTEQRVFRAPMFGVDGVALVKQRFKKRYRHPTLDDQLTTKRIKEEARSLQRSQRAGLHVPTVYAVDLVRHSIYMEYIDAPSAKAYLQAAYTGQQTYSVDLEPLAQRIGTGLAQLHDLNIIHGDLTTSNMLVRSGEGDDSQIDLVFIDFGLSYQSNMAEDKGVDLYVLERALSSTHPATEQLWKSIIQVYIASSKNGPAVGKKLEDVRRRGRKRTMIG